MNIDTINLYSEEFIILLEEQEINLSDAFKEIQQVLNSITSDSLIPIFIKAPVIDFTIKLHLISEITKNTNILNIFSVLEKNGKIEFFVEIIQEVLQLIKRKNGITDVVVTSVVPLNKNQVKKVQKLVKQIFNFNSEVTNIIDNNIIGGLMIKVNNNILDLSLKNQFEMMNDAISIVLSAT